MQQYYILHAITGLLVDRKDDNMKGFVLGVVLTLGLVGIEPVAPSVGFIGPPVIGPIKPPAVTAICYQSYPYWKCSIEKITYQCNPIINNDSK